MVPIGTSTNPTLLIFPPNAKTLVPLDFSVPKLENHLLPFLKIEGKPFVVGGDLQKMARIPDGWINDMYYNIIGLTDVPIDATYVLNDEEQTGMGLIVTHANAPRDDRRLVMIRDSYVMNMAPVLLSYFKQSTLIHWKKVEETEKEHFESGDIFVIEYVERYLRDLEDLLDDILAK